MPALPEKTYVGHFIRTATVRERMGLKLNRCTLLAPRNAATAPRENA
jgi:hypothetical protein